MEKKEAFVSWAQEFIEDLRVGEVKTQRV